MTGQHSTDADCLATIDPITLDCTVCGVDHSGAPCNWCGAVGFHERGCLSPLNDAELEPASARFLGEDATRRQLEHLARVNGGAVREVGVQAYPWGSVIATLLDGSKLQSRRDGDRDVFAIARVQPNGSWALIHQAVDAR